MPYTPHPWDAWQPPLKDKRARPADWEAPFLSWQGVLTLVLSLGGVVAISAGFLLLAQRNTMGLGLFILVLVVTVIVGFASNRTAEAGDA